MTHLSKAYLSVYQNLDEVRGGGRIDPVSDLPHHGERGSRSSKDAGLKMSPIDRAEARANALKKRNDPEATKRANRIQSRFVSPTKRGIGRAITASNVARAAEKKRLMNPQESKEYTQLLQYLYFEGYSDSYAEAEELLESMSTEEFEELVEEVFYEEKNDSYLETDMNKRKKNNEKAIEDMKKTAAHKDMIATVRNKFNEEVDLFDYLLEYLVAEGYADTNASAIAIMANMSEEWREEILDEAVRGSERSIANRITGNDIRRVTRGNKDVYKKPKSHDDIENKVSRGSQLRKTAETENTNDRRDRERIEANKKSIKRLNAKPGPDSGDYDAGYHGDDDTSGGDRHYSLSRTNRDARRRRASGR